MGLFKSEGYRRILRHGLLNIGHSNHSMQRAPVKVSPIRNNTVAATSASKVDGNIRNRIVSPVPDDR
jgi:hypothetical protein